MVSTISINPALTSNAAGSFGITWNGLVQGTAFPDPATRFALASGYLALSETLPMWGGVGITEGIPGAANTPSESLGGPITRATSLTGSTALTGFSVFDQAYGMVNSPQSQVQLGAAYSQVMFYRLGSGARLVVAADPGLVGLDGAIITSQVSWDFNTQRLQEYVASGATEAVTSMTWSNTNGGQIAVVMTGASVFVLGDTVYVSGATNTGTGGASAVNGAFVINTWTDSTHFTLAAPAAAGVIATIAGTIVLNVGTGALACKILKIKADNNMVVAYDPATGFANWNRNGCAAVIQI